MTAVKAAKAAPIRRDWVAKTLAGALMGFLLALACSGLFVYFNPDMAMSPRGQLAMWIVPPITLLTLGACYFFSSGLRAWLWLGGVNVVFCGALFILRMP